MRFLGSGQFAALDWVVVGIYLLAVIAIGMWAGRRRSGDDDYFLAGRSMPMWAVAISVLATSQSAATFVGGPQQSFAGNLTYLAASVAPILAAVLVAVIFIPAYYRARVTSVYELIGREYGLAAQRAASGMFMIGRIFASGARLYIVAIPFSLIAFGNLNSTSMILAIAIIAATATAYTTVGGIRAVIWTDVMQAVIYITTICAALWLLWSLLPANVETMMSVLRTEGDRGKLTVLDTGLDAATFADFIGRPYTIWAILIGMTLFNLAAFGTDQDLAQRMLTCKTARSGSWSVIVANLIGLPIVFLFLVMGLLLFLYYERPDAMGIAETTASIDDTRSVFLRFILEEMPVGMRGLMLAGVFAASMSSLDSVLNALTSTTVSDFLRRRQGDAATQPSNRRPEASLARVITFGWAVVLSAFAIICTFWQQRSGQTLIDFALGVMVYAYAGMLAVFLCATLTRRGNTLSVLCSLAAGFLMVLIMEPVIWNRWTAWLGWNFTPAFSWKMTIATTISFLVCIAGRPSHRPARHDAG